MLQGEIAMAVGVGTPPMLGLNGPPARQPGLQARPGSRFNLKTGSEHGGRVTIMIRKTRRAEVIPVLIRFVRCPTWHTKIP